MVAYLPDMTSLAVSGQLQITNEHCVRCVKTQRLQPVKKIGFLVQASAILDFQLPLSYANVGARFNGNRDPENKRLAIGMFIFSRLFAGLLSLKSTSYFELKSSQNKAVFERRRVLYPMHAGGL